MRIMGLPFRTDKTPANEGVKTEGQSLYTVVVMAGAKWRVYEYVHRLRWRRINPADMTPGRPHRYERVD
jgi:hypothetical protein